MYLMPLFRNFKECVEIVSIMLDDFTKEGKEQIEETILFCECLEKDAEKTFCLVRSVKKELWHVPLAVSKGFDKYLFSRVEEIKVFKEYQKVN